MKPMLASPAPEPSALCFPLLASPKLDGIRCLLIRSPRTGNRLAASRSLKPIPNLHIRHMLENSSLPDGIDGELIVGTNFQSTSSGVMSVKGEPHFCYLAFDYVEQGVAGSVGAMARYAQLLSIGDRNKLSWFQVLEQRIVNNIAELDAYEAHCLSEGYEGVMLKHPQHQYRHGRAPASTQTLMKLKRFTDSDARVVGFTELMHNENEQTLDNLGLAERSSLQENLLPGNKLGALIVRDCATHIEFKIGTGFTDAMRRDIWRNREQWLNKIVTYKYQNHGIKVAPRAPVFLRERLDAKI